MGYKMMIPLVFWLVPCKPCFHHAILSATKSPLKWSLAALHNFYQLSCLCYRLNERINSHFVLWWLNKMETVWLGLCDGSSKSCPVAEEREWNVDQILCVYVTKVLLFALQVHPDLSRQLLQDGYRLDEIPDDEDLDLIPPKAMGSSVCCCSEGPSCSMQWCRCHGLNLTKAQLQLLSLTLVTGGAWGLSF